MICRDVFQLLQQEKHELRVQLDAAVMSSCQADADHRADLEDMQRRLDDVESRASAQQHADRQSIDELTRENERLSEQLLTVSVYDVSTVCALLALSDLIHTSVKFG